MSKGKYYVGYVVTVLCGMFTMVATAASHAKLSLGGQNQDMCMYMCKYVLS